MQIPDFFILNFSDNKEKGIVIKLKIFFFFFSNVLMLFSKLFMAGPFSIRRPKNENINSNIENLHITITLPPETNSTTITATSTTRTNPESNEINSGTIKKPLGENLYSFC